MQITIQDHDTSHYGKRSGFLFNIVFSVGNEAEFGITRNLATSFSDIAAYLQAACIIDGYDDRDDDGQIWVNMDRTYMYDFNSFIKEHFFTQEADKWLADYCEIKTSMSAESVIEDIALI